MVPDNEPGIYDNLIKSDPRPYQRAIVEATAKMPYCALFLEQGLGKSKIALDTLSVLHTYEEVELAVILSRKAVVENWYYEEIDKHLLPKSFNFLYSTRTKKKAPEPGRMPDTLKVIMINDGCLRTNEGYAYIERIMALYKCILIIDESTLVKNPDASLTKKVLKLKSLANYRRVLCGEPAPQGPKDFFSQYQFLSPGILGCRSFTAFKSMFCKMKALYLNHKAGFDGAGRQIFESRRKMIPTREWADGMKEVFEDRVKGCTVRLRKADVLPELPDKMYISKKYELPPDIRKAYDRLKDQFFTELTIAEVSGTLTSTVAAARAIRLHQMITGTFVDDDLGAQSFDSGRLEVLDSIIQDRPEGSKTIIWAHYRDNIDQIVKHLKENYPEHTTTFIYGGISEADRQAAIKAFRESPTTGYLVANQATLAWGVTLTEADANIYYSNSYNWEHRAQSEDRTHRIGQDSNKVLYFDIVAVNTIDEAIIDVLKDKKGFGLAMMQELSKVFAP